MQKVQIKGANVLSANFSFHSSSLDTQVQGTVDFKFFKFYFTYFLPKDTRN